VWHQLNATSTASFTAAVQQKRTFAPFHPAPASFATVQRLLATITIRKLRPVRRSRSTDVTAIQTTSATSTLATLTAEQAVVRTAVRLTKRARRARSKLAQRRPTAWATTSARR
jgi:hypothetical protein